MTGTKNQGRTMSETRKTFDNIQDFYDDDPRRRRSREAMYGVMWPVSRRNVTAEVSYVQETGEIYMRTHTGEEPVTVLGYWPADDQEIFYQGLEERLEGWPDMCTKPEGLRWLQSKLHPTPYWVRREAGAE